MPDSQSKNDPVVFVETTPQPASSAAVSIQAAKAAATRENVRVRVVAPYRVVHEGRPYVGGDAVTVPADTANHWLKNTWAELIPARSKPASQKGES